MRYAAQITWTPAGIFDPFDIDFGGAAVSARPDRIEATLAAEGDTPLAALDAIVARVLHVIPGELVAAEIMTLAEQDRRLAWPAQA